MAQPPPLQHPQVIQTNLPQGDPIFAAIEAFMRSRQTGKGKGKLRQVDTEMKHKAEDAIIAYMKRNAMSFVMIGDQYLVIKESTKTEGWCDELVLKAFIAFHQRNLNQGTLDVVAQRFLEFCKSARRTDERRECLKVQTKRPVSALILDIGKNARI